VCTTVETNLILSKAYSKHVSYLARVFFFLSRFAFFKNAFEMKQKRAICCIFVRGVETIEVIAILGKS
jgi:hypothetical protein